MIKLSVVVPVAGGRATNLRNSLLSLTLQTLPTDQFEVIVVSDAAETELFKSVDSFSNLLDIRYIHTPKYQPRQDRPPRNKGARLARAPHVIFLDSDIILDSQALSFYVEDFEANPLGAVAGMYDWLPPCRIDARLVEQGLDAIYELGPVTLPDGTQDLEIKLKIPLLPWPKGGPTHNTSRDMRRTMFMATEPDVVHMGWHTARNVYLGMFSGNLGFNLQAFHKSGGYWDDLTAGLVDDGALGLTWCVLSEARNAQQQLIYVDEHTLPNPEFGIRLDKRIKACHQYHDRNVAWVQSQSAKEVKVINRRFRLDEYDDGRPPVMAKSLETMTLEVQEAWGVSAWSKEFHDTASE